MQSVWPSRATQALCHIRELASRWRVTWTLPMRLSHPLPDSILNVPFDENYMPGPFFDDMQAPIWPNSIPYGNTQ